MRKDGRFNRKEQKRREEAETDTRGRIGLEVREALEAEPAEVGRCSDAVRCCAWKRSQEILK